MKNSSKSKRNKDAIKVNVVQNVSSESKSKKKDLEVRDIAVTNDRVLSPTGYKDNRRVLVVGKDKKNRIEVARISSTDNKKDKVKSGKLIPINYKNYKCLDRASGVSVYSTKHDANGRRLKSNDKRLRPTNDKISKKEMRKIRKKRKKYFRRLRENRSKGKKQK